MSTSETPAFSIGDVVVVKGQTVKMTVGKLWDDGMVGCVWFVESQLHRDVFAAGALRKVNA